MVLDWNSEPTGRGGGGGSRVKRNNHSATLPPRKNVITFKKSRPVATVIVDIYLSPTKSKQSFKEFYNSIK